VDEEVVLLEEQLASAHADVENLQSRLADAEALLGTREAALTDLRRQLDAARAELAQREETLASLQAEVDAVRTGAAEALAQSRQAAQRYREAVLAREPELPGDLVSGETVAEIDEAVERARQTVARVRQHIEAQAQAQRIPVGAPARSGPDFSGLSAAEKIRAGLQRD
jgi:chemotaxis protein MotB